MKSAHPVLLAVVLACPVSVFAGPRYAFVDLGTLSSDASGGRYVEPVAINNHGHVVGSFSKYDTAQNLKYVGLRPFYQSTSAGLREMSTLGGTDSYYGRNFTITTDINDFFVIVGSSQSSPPPKHSSEPSPSPPYQVAPFQLGTFGTNTSLNSASAVNADGAIVGFGTRVRPGHNVTDQLAVSFTTSAATPIDIPDNSDRGGSTGEYYSFANDLNNTGSVAGYFRLYASNGADYGTRSFVLDPGTLSVRTLPMFGTQLGTNKASASIGGINSAGFVVGSSSIYDPQLGSRGAGSFIWTAGSSTLTTIPSLGTNEYGQSSSSASAINDLNQVVGSSYRYDNNHLLVGTDKHADVYSDGTISDLNDLIDFSYLEIVSAADINKYGQIVGSAKDPSGNVQAFILNPIALLVSALKPNGTLGGVPGDPGTVTYVFSGQSAPGTFSSQYAAVDDPTSSSSQSAHRYCPIDFLLPGPSAERYTLHLDVALDPAALATLTLSFNPALLARDTDPAAPGVYQYVADQWQFLGGTLDPLAHTLTFQADSLSPFMFVLSPIPEPAAICLLLCLPITHRSPRRR